MLSGNCAALINVCWAVSKYNIPVIRRFSGGGTVITDENTIFASLIGNEDFLSEYKVRLDLYMVVGLCIACLLLLRLILYIDIRVS